MEKRVKPTPAHAAAMNQYVEQTRDDRAAAIKRWRDGGGYEGALQRTGQVRHAPYQSPMPARGHMPFPGHRDMGETG